MLLESEISFGSQKYLCLGKSIALMELGTFFSEEGSTQAPFHRDAKPPKLKEAIEQGRRTTQANLGRDENDGSVVHTPRRLQGEKRVNVCVR
ncbi:hypothetical protein B0H67DRAFT_595845 [Lasiosphaeris hirsuta]|uniref:Cytochrome P450 n=1 Tax=Lasiosphaeris hirsuta TaxID=260670 RepID=A0AA39ZPJ8_9PEZI|nr:hypothetical protein B0H67DRAFT_595845 [Lasiosphaeris hirsuta]